MVIYIDKTKSKNRHIDQVSKPSAHHENLDIELQNSFNSTNINLRPKLFPLIPSKFEDTEKENKIVYFYISSTN